MSNERKRKAVSEQNKALNEWANRTFFGAAKKDGRSCPHPEWEIKVDRIMGGGTRRLIFKRCLKCKRLKREMIRLDKGEK